MDKLSFRRNVSMLALAVLSGAGSLWAQKPALEFQTTTNASQVGTSFVAGYQFSVTTPITVSSLGAALDRSPSKAVFGALPASMQVGLWDSSQRLLATTTVYDTDPLSGNFNYSAIPPLVLAPGQTYVVAGLVSSGKSILSNVPKLATDPQVKYIGPRSATSNNLAFPGGDVIGERNGYFAASFAFTAPLAIVNYRLVSQTPGNSRYRADLVNAGAAYAWVAATVTSSDPSIRISPGQDTLTFAPVPANSTATTDDVFMVKGDSPLDTSKLQWSFRTVTTPSPTSGPIVFAGQDQSVTVGETVTLDGSGSSFAAGNLQSTGGGLTYNWGFTARPSGSAAALAVPNSAAPSFVPDRPGAYVVNLTVSAGSASSSDSVTVNAAAAVPVANAGSDLTVRAGSRVDLDGSGSVPGKGKTLQYTWELTALPFGVSVPLKASNTASPWLEAPGPGSYTVQLVVNDGDDDSAPDSITVTAVSGPLGGDIILPAGVKVNSGRFTPMQILLVHPAPRGGISVSLASSDTSKATVSPATIFFPEGATASTQARISGVNAGATEVIVSAAGLTARSATIDVQ